MERDPIARLREFAKGTPRIAVLLALTTALLVGALMAIAAAALGYAASEVVLIAVLAGIGAIPAVYRFLR